jgi:parvulin-like peptidyl-prolyl isomerase
VAVEEFRNSFLVQQLMAKLTESVQATDQEVQDYYNKNAAAMVKPGEWKVREIVVADEETAKQIAAALSQGADFAQTAQQKSKGKTAAQGGDLGYLKDPQEFSFPQMIQVVLSLNVGSVSSVVAGPQGFYLFKLDDKKGGEPLKFEDIKSAIKEQVNNDKRIQVVDQYLENLRKSVDIQINEKLLEE